MSYKWISVGMKMASDVSAAALITNNTHGHSHCSMVASVSSATAI